jgi:hypothetical protein
MSYGDEPTVMEKQPKWGPGYQPVNAVLYRIEYAILFLAVVAYLGWRGTQLAGSDATAYWLAFVFWIIFPDLAAFIPIGLASRSRQWPSWGSRLYNTVHTVVVWAIVFGATWLLFQSPNWPMMAWLAHIWADRAVGYYLRAR